MEDLELTQPATALKIKKHLSEIIPITAFNIDESTIAGNVNAMEAVHTELREAVNSPSFLARVKPAGGDLLTLLRWRAIENLRAGQEGGYLYWHWGMWIIGLFHAVMTDMTGNFLTYWGKPSAPSSNPASLSFHNTCLNRAPITVTSLPPYRTCRDLAYVSLYARVLHCLLRCGRRCITGQTNDIIDLDLSEPMGTSVEHSRHGLHVRITGWTKQAGLGIVAVQAPVPDPAFIIS